MLIGEKIRKVRELKGFSQEYLAMRLGISQKTYSKIESNQSRLDFTRLDKIATTLEIELIQLIFFSDKDFFDDNSFYQERKDVYHKYILHLEEENKFLKNQIKKLIDK